MTATSTVVVFDLDDTLYPEADYARSGLRAAGRYAAATLSLPQFEEEAIRLFDAGRRGTIFQDTLRTLGAAHLAQTAVPQLLEIYRTHRPALRLYPDAAEAIATLAPKYRLAIITDGYLPPQRLKVEALGLGDKCDPILYTEELGRDAWKPAVRAFVHLESACGVTGGDCIYIADNPVKDFIAPRLRGWRSIRIRRPQTEHCGREAAPGCAADLEIASLAQLSEQL